LSAEIINLLRRLIIKASEWGDMLKNVYDPNTDGVVADSDKLEGNTKTEVQNHTPKAHTLASHSTKAHPELTGVTASQHHTKTTSLTEISPDYDSGWVAVAFDETYVFTHNLDTMDLLPVIYYRTGAGQAHTLWGCGNTNMGDAWLDTVNSIRVCNNWANKEIRVLLWKF